MDYYGMSSNRQLFWNIFLSFFKVQCIPWCDYNDTTRPSRYIFFNQMDPLAYASRAQTTDVFISCCCAISSACNRSLCLHWCCRRWNFANRTKNQRAMPYYVYNVFQWCRRTNNTDGPCRLNRKWNSTSGSYTQLAGGPAKKNLLLSAVLTLIAWWYKTICKRTHCAFLARLLLLRSVFGA